MTNDERDKIAALCKKHSKERGNARLGWATKTTIGKTLPLHDYEKIIGVIRRDPDYFVSEKGDSDFNIKFIGRNWAQRHPYWDWFIKLFIGAIITAIIGLLFALPKFKADNRLNKEQNQRLDSLEKNLRQ